MSSMSSILETHQLSYKFSTGQPVLQQVNIAVPEGAIYGFLGPNGAGKTTTMRLLTGLLPYKGEHIRFFNKPLQEQLPTLFHKVGSLIETPSLYLHLSGLDNLRLVARLKQLPEARAKDALNWVGLKDAQHKKAKLYSLGMKQRLAIAMALISEPELLLLDEPVNGLDPGGMVEIREMLVDLNKHKGITIFISSHLLNEVEKMCTHIGIIHKGTMRFQGSISELASTAAHERQIDIGIQDAAQWLPVLQEAYPKVACIQSDLLQVTVAGKEDAVAINRMLVNAGAPVHQLQMKDGLEEWFMTITKN